MLMQLNVSKCNKTTDTRDGIAQWILLTAFELPRPNGPQVLTKSEKPNFLD